MQWLLPACLWEGRLQVLHPHTSCPAPHFFLFENQLLKEEVTCPSTVNEHISLLLPNTIDTTPYDADANNTS
jgi:hypothetical protein